MIAALVLGTLVSEDLTCIVAGTLVRRGDLDAVTAVAACAAGIYVGDLALWCVGRVFASRVQKWPRVRDGISTYSGPIVLASRFAPGTRLPLYLAAGAFQTSFTSFAAWSLAAVLLWTPPVVLLSRHVVTLTFVTVLVTFAAYRLGLMMATRRGRQRLIAAVSRIWRWEFWPMWLFYAPVAVWIAWLVVRHRGIGPLSAANPGIEDGGIVGESKHAILSRLPEKWTIPSMKLEPADDDARATRLADMRSGARWNWPLVLKPDVGQRGTGVKIVRSIAEARAYFTRERGTVLVQPFHPGPFEAGVFYYRHPGSARGRILSITDKHFPEVTGDGRSTLEELIWADARLRMQASTFLARYASTRLNVPRAGESVRLGMAGNHAQGALFRDGADLITPALEDRIEQIARAFPGFFIGRFDIRYADADRFRAGQDLAIVELNGATAESTNIYDPDSTLVRAYGQLFHQWSLVFEIGAANQAAGVPASSVSRVAHLLRVHLGSAPAFATSD